MAEVILEQVSKTYPGGVQAVINLSLTVRAGELLVLVGPSGCGKTTTLRLIAGLEEPTRGRVRIGGREMKSVPPWQRDVALVFQRPALYPHLTTRQNLAFGLTLREHNGWLRRWAQRLFWPSSYREMLSREAADSARVAETASLLGLEGVLERSPGELSGGQQQRVALGRALARRPAVLLLDEPLSNLDSRLRVELRRELHLLHRRFPATIVYVTHDPVEALTLGDRIAVLDAGALQQLDRPLTVYRQPRNRFVAGFLGWPSMNFLDGRLLTEGNQTYFVGKGLKLPLPTGRGFPAGATNGQVTVGIRPQDVQVRPLSGEEGGLVQPATITLTELLGDRMLLTCAGDGWQLTSLADGGAALAEGQPVRLSLRMDQAYLFDLCSGQALETG